MDPARPASAPTAPPRRRLQGVDAVMAALRQDEPLTTILLPRSCPAERSSGTRGLDTDQWAQLRATAEARGIPIWWASEGDLRRMSRDSQRPAEVLACAGPPKTADLEVAMGRGGLTWLMQRPAYASNVGYAIRTAEVSGADALVVDSASFNHGDRSRASHVSMGADRLLPVIYADTSEVLGCGHALGHRIVAIEDVGAVAPWELDLTGPLTLIVGNERDGIDAGTLARCDATVRIPMPGFVPSYNLQAALAAIASERLRQLQQA